MKKYIGLSVVTLVLIMLSSFIPKIADNMITSVEIIRPSKKSVNEDIFTSGTIEELKKKDITVDIPIVPRDVNVQIGDYVDTQDVIATIDTQATQEALFGLAESVNLIPQEYQEYVEVLGDMNISQSMVKDYIPTEIVSPTSGIVTEINLVEGAMSYPKSTVCTISKVDSLRAKMTIDELDADKIKLNDMVVFKASATKDVKYTGKIERIFPTATKTLSGTSQVTVVGLYVKLDEQYARLKPGYNVSGVVKKFTDKVSITVPYEAVLQDDNGEEYLYVYDNGHAIRKNIITGQEFPETVEITNGIDESALVIKNAADIKKDNAKVKAEN